MPESQKIVKVPFKVFRGMASIGAISDRLDLEDATAVELEAIGAEGMEVSVPARGSARPVVHDMLKHLCSSISYGGAEQPRGSAARSSRRSGPLSDPPHRVVSSRIVRAREECQAQLQTLQ